MLLLTASCPKTEYIHFSVPNLSCFRLTGSPWATPPVCVSYRYGWRRGSDHVLHLEGFDANDLVFVTQFAGGLMQGIRTAIGTFDVVLGVFKAGFGVVV